MNKLTDKVAVIAGASKGIGAGIAKSLKWGEITGKQKLRLWRCVY